MVIEMKSVIYTRTTSSRTSYRSRRRFLFQSKRRLSFTPLLLLSAKGHARLACSLVNALTTARCRYQPFAGFRVCRCHHSYHVVADFVSFATTFSFSKQTPSLIHSVAPPFRIEPAPLGFDSGITAVVIITHTAPSRTSYRSRRHFLFQSKRRLSFTPSLLLSESNPLRWASIRRSQPS